MVSFPEPTFDETRAKIMDLIRGTATPEEVAAWASQWVMDDDNAVQDPAIWQALDALAGADLEVEPGELLHSDADFHTWLDELETSHASDAGEGQRD
jgi:hypothetical protein